MKILPYIKRPYTFLTEFLHEDLSPAFQLGRWVWTLGFVMAITTVVVQILWLSIWWLFAVIPIIMLCLVIMFVGYFMTGVSVGVINDEQRNAWKNNQTPYEVRYGVKMRKPRRWLQS